jgi:hypothetical protein
MEVYYHITSATQYPALPEDNWEADFRRQFPCSHRPDERPLDVVLKDPGEDIALNTVAVGAGAIIRSDFLQMLGPEGARTLLLGHVFDADRKQLANRYTLGTDYTLRLRGDPRSTRQFCKQCGRFLYYPFGKLYVLQSDLRDQAVYYSEGLMYGLLVRGNLYARLKPLRLTKLYIARMPVLAKPEDGLPADLSQVTPAHLLPVRG